MYCLAKVQNLKQNMTFIMTLHPTEFLHMYCISKKINNQIIERAKHSFPDRRTPETLPSVEKFFGSSLSLSHISLSGTKVPPELLR